MKKLLCVSLLCCGSATGVFAKDEKKEVKSASLNELNPITHYVNVCQQTEGKDKKFILCDSKDKSCTQPEERTTKHLAKAK
jgi:hypothetical protein